MPASFTLSDTHAAYTVNNHWTTSGGPAAEQFALYNLGTDQSVTHLYLWNHRSTSPPAFSVNYGVTQFDLTFLDAGSNILGSVNNVAATTGTAAVQTYSFTQFSKVRFIKFSIDSNAGDALTGLAEIRFGFVAIPEPSTTLLLVFGLGALLARPRLVPSRRRLPADRCARN